MRKAFTLIELIVALGILALMMMFASTIFRVSVSAQRMAVANGEIMQKLRVITEQLDADFRGMLKPYGGVITDQNDSYDDEYGKETVHADAIAFFANGDFQSTRQYGDKTIAGNVASILYAVPDPGSYGYVRRPAPANRLLLRRQTILAPQKSSTTAIKEASDWRGEYYCTSLEEWRLSPPYEPSESWTERPVITPNRPQDYLPMYLARGVDNFTISYLPGGTQWNTGRIQWYRDDPNEPNDPNATRIIPVPRAIRFEFTLYDSKGIIKKGRTFSHIVLLDG